MSGDRLVFPGCYRGIVRVNNDSLDSENNHRYLGRLRVSVPQVYGDKIDDKDLPYASPCQPFTTGKDGDAEFGFIAIPPIGSSVWVMFEAGDPQKPVWMGGWWGELEGQSEIPDRAKSDGSYATYPGIFLIRTRGGGEIRVSGDQKMEISLGEFSIKYDKKDKLLTISAYNEFATLKRASSVKVDAKDVNIVARGDGSAAGEVNISGGDTTIRGGNTLRLEGAVIEIVAEQLYLTAMGKAATDSTPAVPGCATLRSDKAAGFLPR